MSDFQRARSPEQREARRQAILGVAEELLTEMPVSEISLRELARRVGLSKTNVVRYFETREAVFFALLNRALGEWLDGLELPAGPPAGVVEALARSVAGRPLICDLWSALGTELERNISAEAVRDFKLANGELQARLATMLRERIPELTEQSARELVSYTVLLIAGLWPFANPSPGVAEAVQDPRLAGSRVDFAERLGRALVVAVTGLLTLDSAAQRR
ncbi:TetR family transcriptional regulator [Paractinoplanes atraurantiacus]|uniref:DNA-binding transcriptional regulator, AcrR family n=1 Tax=Paractinoplanes atraurantiacus TaxID=1036182 RepID=A0A285IPJ1_9ACTN|nr:TetR family transcriptional regulator [Actinoplanes atraurantiacus]SNY49753.1 DNA-binding transcriptional regulator, AcrR family [Actinoplanes atraurantiacus]